MLNNVDDADNDNQAAACPQHCRMPGQMHGCLCQCSTPGMDDANNWRMVSELRCTKHNNVDKIACGRDSMWTIWGEEEGKGDARRLAVAARQAFDLCWRPRIYCLYTLSHSSTLLRMTGLAIVALQLPTTILSHSSTKHPVWVGCGYCAECGVRNVESCHGVICGKSCEEHSANYPYRFSAFRGWKIPHFRGLQNYRLPALYNRCATDA